jgi:hypothetical protein
MHHISKFLLGALASLSLISAASLRATPVTVSEIGVGANEIVWINSSSLGSNLQVYAGALNFLVDGSALQGFCIDPWHWSQNGALAYDQVALADAPKSANNSTANPMGASTALQIEQLWFKYYTPSMTNVDAAALQITIWQLVDSAVSNGTFQLISVNGGDSSAVYSSMTGMTTFLANNPGAAAANLFGLTGPGQDYVISRPGGNVPDSGSTALLASMALLGFAAFRRRSPAS